MRSAGPAAPTDGGGRTSSAGIVAGTRRPAHPRGMRTAPRLLLSLSLAAGAVLGPTLPALAAGSGTTTVRPSAEGWYRTTPACTLPTGCAALPAPSQYSPDTLHVGVHAGTEEARTYLQLDLTQLPSGTRPSGGTLLLPVAAGSNDGTRAPETAELRACAVTGEVSDVDGSFATPPAADCETAEAAATFVPAAGENPAAFTVDLAPLIFAWDSAATPGALALVPATETAPPDSWHVAFSDRTRTGDAVVPITAAVAFVSASLATETIAVPSVAAPAFEPAPAPAFASSSGVDVDAGTSVAAPALSDQAPLLPAPVAQAAPGPVTTAPVQQVVPVAQSVVQGGFRYPAVFLLPLLLAVGAGWLGRAMTRDLVEP